MSAAHIFLALLIGMLASGPHVVFHRGRISDAAVYGYLIGGALGGLVGAFLVGPVGTHLRNDIVLVWLTGYVCAGWLVAWVRPARKRT